MDFAISWLTATWDTILEAAPWLLFGFAAAGAIYVLLPAQQVARHLGRPGWGAVIKAALIGMPLPLCSCSVIPVASSLRQRGAGRGATASFLVSTPESGVDSIALSYALLGPFLAIVRPLAALVTAIAAGGLINVFDKTAVRDAGASLQQVPQPGGATSGSCCCAHEHAPPRPTLLGRGREAAQYGFVEMFADLAHWLVLGFILAGLVSALVPPGFFDRIVGGGLVAMLLMLVAGLPLYVCATSVTPLAAALIAKGVSPGAALVFLLVGPATNVATMVVVGRDLGRRSLAIYVISIAVVAVALGLAVDAMPWASNAVDDARQHVHYHAASIWTWLAAIALCGLMLNGLRIRARRSLRKAGQDSACAPEIGKAGA